MPDDKNVSLTDEDYKAYINLTNRLDEVLRALFAVHPAVAVEITARTKSKTSIADKLQRKNYKTLREMEDICGARIVCLSRNVIGTIKEILVSEFSLLRHESTADRLSPTQMGYQDNKFIMTLGPKYLNAADRHYADRPFEIQVRTIFQNAWAVFSHVLLYKREDDVPPELRRRINAISASCEVLDDAAERIYSERARYVSNTVSDLRATESRLDQIPLNFDTLAAYTTEKYPNKLVQSNLQNLVLSNIDRQQFSTIGDIERAVHAADGFLKWYSKQRPDVFQWGTDYITKALGFYSESFRNAHGFSRETREAFAQFRI